MALQILNQPDDVLDRVKRAIEAAIEGADVRVSSMSPGHFEIRVVSGAFAGLGRVKQQQLVYAAITPLMSGDAPPVHAIDRLETVTP
jgi:acid stress-induced BolA-like protein IbaG/YrbA